MWRSVASNGMLVLIALFLALAVAINWGRGQWTAEGPSEQAFCLRVPSGSNLGRVTDELDERGAIASRTLFRAGTDYAELPGLKAGDYLIPERASMAQIADIVTRGGASTCGTDVNFRVKVAGADVVVRELDPSTESLAEIARFEADETPPPEYAAVRAEPGTRYRVTVSEGVTSWQVIDALARAEFLAGEAPEVPAEGTLAPDSYEVAEGADRAELVQRMIEAQQERLAAAWAGRDPDLPFDTPEEALTLASIVEKETGVAAERGQVASVFVNRLRDGMRLQTDPTVIYGITNGEGILGRGLRQSELERETPYNTYRIDGLPPGPIANPGEASLRAALNPDETDYLFFVADGTGGHAFARTLDEHNRNVAEWRRIEAEQANQ